MRPHELQVTRVKSEEKSADVLARVGVACLLLADGATGSRQEAEVDEVVRRSAAAGWPATWLLTGMVGC